MAGRDETSFISQPSGQESGGSTAVRRGIFTREGEFWRIGLEGGDSFALRHTRGLAYLAQLLRFSGREFHALDLISGTASDFEEMSASRRAALPRGDRALASAGIHVGDLGDAGEMLD